MPIQKGPANLGTGVIDATELASGSVTTAKLATTLTVTHALGSASTPSITFTGDTNTGIFSPTADTIAFAEGGTEVMRINASGNLGVGPAGTSTNTVSSGLAINNATAGNYPGLEIQTANTTRLFLNANNAESYISSPSNPLVFVTGSTERLRIPSDASGIKFPATQVASSDANTLDDYEEGSWTPVNASIASLTFSVTQATYVKIGRLVFITAYLNYPSTADTNSAKIGGLPFAVNSTGNNAYSYVSGRTGYSATGQIFWQLVPGQTEMLAYGNAGVSSINNNNLSGQYVLLSGCYTSNS